MNADQLEFELFRLQRKLRHTQFLAAGALGLSAIFAAGVISFVRAIPPAPPLVIPDELTIRKLSIVDAAGEPRVVLAADKSGFGMLVGTPSGVLITCGDFGQMSGLSITQKSRGASLFAVIHDESATPGLALRSKNLTKLEAEATDEGASLLLYDEHAKKVISLMSGTTGNFLALIHSLSDSMVSLVAVPNDHNCSVDLYDRNGRASREFNCDGSDVRISGH